MVWGRISGTCGWTERLTMERICSGEVRAGLREFRLWEGVERLRGFTLFETLLALILIGATVSLVALGSYGAKGGYNLSAAAQTISQDIRLVQQMNANQDGTAYSIIFDCARERYLIVRGLGVSALRVVNLPAGVDLVYTDFADNTLGFYTDGKPRPYGGHLALRDRSGRYLYVIVQTITGRVRIDVQPPPGK